MSSSDIAKSQCGGRGGRGHRGGLAMGGHHDAAATDHDSRSKSRSTGAICSSSPVHVDGLLSVERLLERPSWSVAAASWWSPIANPP
eukprot:5677306-Prymnesium_polylepis.1